MAKNRKRLLATLLLITVLISSSISVAAVVKRTVKKQGFTTNLSVAKKKAATVKKGTTNLTFKGGQGYMKFKAPANKTYTFTFSNVKDKKRGVSAFVEIQKPTVATKYSPSWLQLAKVKTAGGKSNTLWLSVNGYKFKDKKVLNRPIAKRSCKIKMKKGQTVYFYFYNGTNKSTAKLKIK